MRVCAKQAQSNSSLSSHGFTNLTSPSIGFVSNLSQSIIREQNEDDGSRCHGSGGMMANRRTDQTRDLTSEEVQGGGGGAQKTDDDSLALLGAPWAKEGLLQRKQYWDAKGKRHKDKSWAQVFVVIHKGELRMFIFGSGGGSGAGSGAGGKGAMGGGNWLSNAQAVGELSLCHSLSSALPSGYNKERPYAFVLTLGSGCSYFFQAGTSELVNEWVSTCNYWSARLSKEPLTGGVSNMEYGWKEVEEGGSGVSGGKEKVIYDWNPPVPPMSMSSAWGNEEEQLNRLRIHCGYLQDELEKHNALRKRMVRLVSLGFPFFIFFYFFYPCCFWY